MVRRGASRVPERWTDYVPLGRRMPGTRFIAFKVPLKKSFDRNLPPEERFSPHDLLKKIKEQKEELGLIIDLTYTTRYYGPEELPATLCYSKILTMGHEIPNRQTIFQFKCVVKKFLRDNKDNDKLIGVHCTHGLNRTGYLVCRYLIDVEGMEPDAAIELFNKARGHPIERTNYIQDLQKRSVKKEKAGAAANARKQTAKHHPHRSDQFPFAMPRLVPSQQGWQGNSECRNSITTKKNRKRSTTVPTRPQELVRQAQARPQELPREHEAPEQRRPCGLAARNRQVLLPANERRDGLCFPPQNPHFCPPQETQPARKPRKRKRRHRKPAVTP